MLDELIERIVAEAEAMPRACPWCYATLGADDEHFCSPFCAEEYRRKLMPDRGEEHVGVSRPLSPAVKAMMQAGRQRRRYEEAQARPR